MPPDTDPLESLVCPDDHARLARTEDLLRCRACGAEYAVVGGIPDFVSGSRARSARWQAAQRYELAWWAAHGATDRERDRARLARAGAALAALFDDRVGPAWRERAVHVGPAVQGEIHHLPAHERWAVEPLAPALDALGLLEREGVCWVAAMGERLPFADHAFTAGLLPNVIDHVAEPAALLCELHRCLVPGAPLWLTSHVTRPVLAPVLAGLARTRLGYFAGHPFAFTPGRLRALVEAAGFRIVHARTDPTAETGEVGGLRGRLKRRVLGVERVLALA